MYTSKDCFCCRWGDGRPPPERGVGRPPDRGQAGPGFRLLGDQTFINGFTDSVADQVAEAGENLQEHTGNGQGQPAEEDEAVVQRRYEQLFHEPEGVTPFVQSYVRQDHERADYGHQVRQRQPIGEEGQPGLGVQERAKAGDDVDRVAQVELNDVRRGEVGVAHDGLMPGAVLLGEVGGAPVDGVGIGEQPDQVGHVATQFFPRFDRGQVAVTGLPDIAPQDGGGDDFQDDFGVQEVHPVGFEFRCEGIETGGPAVYAFIPTDPGVKDRIDREAEGEPGFVE